MMITTHEYRDYVFRILYRPEEPAYTVEFPDVPEIITSGDTLSEAFSNACEALDLHLESLQKLSNVVRHADAANARVSLSAANDSIQALIEDDGRGIQDANQRAHHYGMTIMRERILSLGGEICLETRPGGGTRVHLSFRHRASVQSQETTH